MKKIILILFYFLVMQNLAYAQAPADYLILQPIGQYHSSGKGRCGTGSGMLGASDHFDEDHIVTTCSTGYYFMAQDLAVSIKVEQHTGGNSDRWLLHEIETDFRTYYGIPGKSYGPRVIDGQTILEDSVGGYSYRWLSGNKVIEVKYIDLQMTKPEPLEVVKAYLAKHPSTIAPFTLQELRNSANVIKWIKDEIDRRLWLCDKWNAQSQAGSVTQADLMVKLLENMNVFLKYREKYFGIAAEDESNLLDTYHENNDIASIQKKLTGYKTWWAKHKEKKISL